MSLTRFLPIPSDRMGILWTLLSIEDGVVLEYAPAGTTSYVKKAYGAMELNIENRIFATGMSKDDVIMGNTSILEQEILRIDRELNPKVIFIMASTVSNVIGTDVKGVCIELEEKVSAQLIIFTQGGFVADFSKGRSIAFTQLIKELSTEKFEETNTYNILGVSQVVHSSEMDIDNIKRIMSEEFDMKENTILSYDTTIDKIKELSKAKINLVISYEALDAAKLLKERFNTPYIYKLPIGNDIEWLNMISKAIKKDRPIVENTQKNIFNKNIKAVIYASFDKGIALGEYLNKLGVEVLNIIVTHKINTIKNIDKPENLIYLKDESEKLKYFKSLENTIVFGDNNISRNINDTNTHVNIENLFLDIYETELSLMDKDIESKIINICEKHLK